MADQPISRSPLARAALAIKADLERVESEVRALGGDALEARRLVQLWYASGGTEGETTEAILLRLRQGLGVAGA